MNVDGSTSTVTRAFDILLLNNPVRTAIGVVIGVVFWGFVPVFSPVIKGFTKLDFSQVPWMAWTAFGILEVSLKGSPVKAGLPEDVEILFDLLDKAKDAGISKFEQRQHFRRLLEKYADNVAFNQKLQKELEEIKKELSNS
jgi:DNA-binding protein YbaB